MSQLRKCLKFRSIRGDKNDCILYKITPRNVTNFRHLLSCDTIESMKKRTKERTMMQMFLKESVKAETRLCPLPNCVPPIDPTINIGSCPLSNCVPLCRHWHAAILIRLIRCLVSSWYHWVILIIFFPYWPFQNDFQCLNDNHFYNLFYISRFRSSSLDRNSSSR